MLTLQPSDGSGRVLGMLAVSSQERSATIAVAAVIAAMVLLGCITLALLHVHLLSKRRQLTHSVEIGTPMPGVGEGDASLQVIVLANDQEAELEILLSAFDTYEDLRELVVDAVPQMFNDADAIVIEYSDGRSWCNVKTKTPIDVVKGARCVRIKSQDDKMSRKIARRAWQRPDTC